jgi:DNA polymerase III delta subunit
MFAEDRTAQFSVVGAFAFHFRRMFNAKVLLEKGVNTTEIAKRLRIWRDRDGFFAQLRKVTLEQIGSILRKLAAIDYAIKTGRTKAEVATEQLVLKLASG